MYIKVYFTTFSFVDSSVVLDRPLVDTGQHHTRDLENSGVFLTILLGSCGDVIAPRKKQTRPRRLTRDYLCVYRFTRSIRVAAFIVLVLLRFPTHLIGS